jgi:DNA-binding MarR family transcriptional regulator
MVLWSDSKQNMATKSSTREKKTARLGPAQSRTQDARIVHIDENRNRDLRLGFLVHDVSRMRRRAFDAFMKPLEITRAQWWIVAHLSRHDGMMQTELSTILDVGKASLGNVLDRLEAGGLISRQPDPTDRRARRVFLTNKAKHLLERMQREERRYNEAILEGLSSAERNELVRMLTILKHNLARVEQSAEK